MLEIGSLTVSMYGLLVGVGILSGFWIAARFSSRFNIRSQEVWDGLFWVVLPAIMLGRIYHVIGIWDYYRDKLLLIPQIWTGGMGIFGSILGGVLGMWLYAQKRGKRFSDFADLGAFGLPIGQALGRWGNFFNKELYGKPTKLPWAIYIDSNNRINGYQEYSYFHPLFLYESLWNLLTFGLLFLIMKRRGSSLAPGSYFAIYLLFYGLGRFWLEFLRIEPWKIGAINAAQAVSTIFVIYGILFLVGNSAKIKA
jgi:phosphatidylglycerol:prolipoprotein diacylglycerol transferase